ncbi:DUF4878 domain-containing protein [Bacillus sp. PK3_68]|uniref:DUF4878 domain-containing protein n=1 Tax=Bacillus sp. PK3_68 TaxID=2027408 RepID=UPI000E7557EC|nr:DUF4878 domain-containing protein [Bacillus sp. PK3_68]RJS62382.1 hypothetical protein CJ483_21980 [Bacillus sp. PK3_68]
MRKLWFVPFLAVAAIAVVVTPFLTNSEIQGSLSPEKFVKEYIELVKAKDHESLVDLVIDDRFNDDREVKLKTYKTLEEGVSPLEDYEIKNVKSGTKDKATVITVIEYEDGSVEQVPMHLVKKDKAWKLYISRGNALDDEDFKLIKQPDGI